MRRLITHAPRFTGEVVVPLLVTFNTAPWVSRPPYGLPAGLGTARRADPATGSRP